MLKQFVHSATIIPFSEWEHGEKNNNKYLQEHMKFFVH